MQVLMPQIGMTMVEGTITKWIVSDGAHVTKGDPMMEIATEKLENEIEVTATGTIKLLAQEGDCVACGEVIAEIIED